MSTNQYTRIRSPFPGDWQPAYISLGLKQVLDAVHAITGIRIYIGQPPYNTLNRASAGTHNKRNCADLYADTANQLKMLCWWLRLLGWPGWVRNPGQGSWPWHLHFFMHGDTGLAPVAADQDDAYIDGYNGLGFQGRAGKDDRKRPRDPRVRHVYKPLEEFEVRFATHGYSQARKDKALIVKTREPGFRITNHVLTVADHTGKQFVVTSSGTFYDRAKLKVLR